MAIRKSSMSGTPSGTSENRPSSPSIGQTYNNGTLGVEEIYTSSGWAAKSSVAPIPVSVTATNQGSSRAFNNGQSSVSFTNGEGGGIPIDYILTPSPATSPATFIASSSPITVTNLQSNIAYTYTVQARNNFGTSLPSAASLAVTATTVPATPSAPTVANTANVAFGSAPSQVVSWTAPATGGSAIIDYTVTSSSGSSQTVSGTSATFTGLTAGTSYTYTLTARNANGSSQVSSASSSLTAATVPQAPTIGTPINTGTGNSAYVFFTANATGGLPITSYTVTSSPGNITATGASSPITITGLTANTSYTFTVRATNATGNSSSSSSSSSVTTSVVSPTIVTANGGLANSGNNGGNGGSGGGSAADMSGSGGGLGGYSGSNGQANSGRFGTGQLGVAYGSGTNPYIPTGGAGGGGTSQAYAGLGPNNHGSGLATVFNQQNTSTRIAGYGRGNGGSEGGWTEQGSAGQDGLIAWTNDLGANGVINDSTSSWSPPANANYTFYAIGGGGGGGGGYYGPGGSGYYATASRYLVTAQTVTMTVGSGGSRGARFGNGGNGGATSVVVNV